MGSQFSLSHKCSRLNQLHRGGLPPRSAPSCLFRLYYFHHRGDASPSKLPRVQQGALSTMSRVPPPPRHRGGLLGIVWGWLGRATHTLVLSGVIAIVPWQRWLLGCLRGAVLPAEAIHQGSSWPARLGGSGLCWGQRGPGAALGCAGTAAPSPARPPVHSCPASGLKSMEKIK